MIASRKIKIFEGDEVKGKNALEKEVNDFLQNPGIRVISIAQSSTVMWRQVSTYEEIDYIVIIITICYEIIE